MHFGSSLQTKTQRSNLRAVRSNHWYAFPKMSQKREEADVIFCGGSIITMDEGNQASAEAVAIAGERILAVGSKEEVFRLKGDKTEEINLNQQTLMPGFIEPHQHAILTAQTNSQYVNISGLNNRCYKEIYDVMEKEMKDIVSVPGCDKWGLFFGWDPELVPHLPTLSAAYLDATFPANVPMAVVGQSGHVAWVNSQALKEANVNNDTPNPCGGTFVRDQEDKLTGQLLEEPAIKGVLDNAPLPSVDAIEASVQEQWQYYASMGLTTVTEMLYVPDQSFDQLLMAISDKETCPIRLALYQLTHPVTSRNKSCCPRFMTPRSGLKSPGIGNHNDKLWEAGVKIIADGSPHSGTAAVQEPYLNTTLTETLGFPPAPDCGILNYEKKDMLDTIKRYHLQGKQLAIHCHGERAAEQVLKSYEEVLAKEPCSSRHRMEHLGLMTPEQIKRAGKIKLGLSFFVDHLRFYGLTFKMDIFGDRVNRWAPLSEATKSDVIWTIHQDHPTFPGQATPFSNMKTAITRCTRDDPNTPYGPEYCVTIHEALKAYTVNAAWQLHIDKDVGSITVGKKADLVLLSDNPCYVEPVDLEKIEVNESFLNGRRIYVRCKDKS